MVVKEPVSLGFCNLVLLKLSGMDFSYFVSLLLYKYTLKTLFSQILSQQSYTFYYLLILLI